MNKKYIKNIEDFRNVLRDFLPSQIWWDEFDTELPYIEGIYKDNKFHGSYVKQSFLVFDIDSLSQLESIFKEGMYIKP